MKRGIKTYRKWFIKLLLVVAFAISGCLVSFAQRLDYKAQSLYIYKFTRHISWPKKQNSEEFRIGIFGNSPILDELKFMAAIKKAGNGQKIKVIQINSISEIHDLHLLYIPTSKSRELKLICQKVGSSPTLIVAERDGLAKKGAVINFLILENNTLKYEINLGNLKKHRLQIAPELLRIGFKVG